MEDTEVACIRDRSHINTSTTKKAEGGANNDANLVTEFIHNS